MEIKINFKKMHFWILLTAIVLIGGWIFVYAAGTQGHLWSEITGKPAGFADDVDNTGGINSVSIDSTDCVYTCYIGSETDMGTPGPTTKCTAYTNPSRFYANCPSGYVAVSMYSRRSEYLDAPLPRALKCCKLKVT